VSYAEGSCSPVGVTLRRAMGRLGEQNYNLLFNNCEHFAHWCKTGRHRSAQVENWLPNAMLTGARLLASQGLQLESGRQLARRSLAQLDQLRRGLQDKLEAELAKAEARWGQDRFASLRLAAQKLADQLAEIEELEERLRRQLEPGEDR
jgi:exonuclease VII large subunit